jgi:excisionase family DNA binding protein
MSLETYTPLSRDPGAGDIFTIHDVAAYLKLPVSTAYRLAERRRLPGSKVGRHWRFHKGTVEDWFRRLVDLPHVSILVADDDPRIRELFSSGLQDVDRRVVRAASGDEALAIARHTAFDLVVLDLVMPGLSGVETFRALRAMRPGLPVIIVTGYPDSDLVAQALAVGPFTLMPKPVSMKTLQQTVTVLVAHCHRSREARTPATVQRGWTHGGR